MNRFSRNGDDFPEIYVLTEIKGIMRFIEDIFLNCVRLDGNIVIKNSIGKARAERQKPAVIGLQSVNRVKIAVKPINKMPNNKATRGLLFAITCFII